VTASANRRLSTAKAPPAGTRDRAAASSVNEPRRRISSFNSAGAVPSSADLNELLQTSSASAPVLWAGVDVAGLIS